MSVILHLKDKALDYYVQDHNHLKFSGYHRVWSQ